MHLLAKSCALGLLVLSASCGTKARMPSEHGSDAALQLSASQASQAKAVVDAKCAGCHRPGDIAPFDLTTHAGIQKLKGAMMSAISSGSMPPWQAASGCNEYSGDSSLSPSEKSLVLRWLDQGAPPSTTQPEKIELGVEKRVPNFDVTVTMDEEYTPKNAPDDYRCFLMRWPKPGASFITGFKFVPGRRENAHHMLAYTVAKESEEDFRKMDANDPGPGYTCFGGPSNSRTNAPRVTQIAAWAPGVEHDQTPDGVGLAIEGDAMIVVQMHYNIQNRAPVPDKSQVLFSTVAEVVRPGASFLWTNPDWLAAGGMKIPAGDANVEKDYSVDLSKALDLVDPSVGFKNGDDFLLHRVALHMHQLGVEAKLELVKKDNSRQCLLHLPKWDFNWQGGFQLARPITVTPGDRLELKCRWDNSAAHQGVVTGTRVPPRDVEWGEGTGDEMCLMGLLITKT